ncbi:MAG: hypothetical protein ACU85V_04100 [Gammaproteobacteria bacterium]
MTGWAIAVGGTLIGAAQAGLLARSLHVASNPFAFLVRLLLVAAVLYVAARAGHLALGAAGWVLGFAAGVAVFRRGMR